MSASDYGLNYGLKPGDKLPSVAALRRQQRAQEQASAIANKTLNALLSHPNQAATRSLLSVSSALLLFRDLLVHFLDVWFLLLMLCFSLRVPFVFVYLRACSQALSCAQPNTQRRLRRPKQSLKLI